MKKVFTLVFVSAISFASLAQKKESKAIFSIGVEGAMPSGSLSESHNFGIGASTKIAMPVSNSAAFTISVGYISFSGKTVTILGSSFKNDAFNIIPIKAGIRGSFDGGFYIEPQLGYTIFSSSNNNSGAFTYAPVIGFTTASNVDFSFRYESATKENSTLSHFGVRLAFGL